MTIGVGNCFDLQVVGRFIALLLALAQIGHG